MIVATSGGFDPIHIGHIRLLKESRALGDRLIVILNNDNWLMKKKGYIFMNQDERKEILEAFAFVDEVIITKHATDDEDTTVCRELSEIKPDIFAKGGDRTAENTPENKVCEEIGCKVVYNVGAGGKVQSSSWLVNKLQSLAPNPA